MTTTARIDTADFTGGGFYLYLIDDEGVEYRYGVLPGGVVFYFDPENPRGAISVLDNHPLTRIESGPYNHTDVYWTGPRP